MNFHVLHLTDFHLITDIEFLNEKLENLSKILKNEDVRNLLVIFSGDFTQSGKKDEFAAFKNILNLITDKLSRFCSVRFSCCNGNHDRCFSDSDEITNEYVSSINKNNFSLEISNKLSLVDNYKAFLSECSLEQNTINDLLSYRDFTFDDTKIRVCSLNNCLLSSYKKGVNLDSGNIKNIFIKNSFLDINRHECDYVFLNTHLPLVYFRPETLNFIKQHLSKDFDLIFSGHTHTECVTESQSSENNLLEITSTATDFKQISGFSLLAFADDNVEIKTYQFNYDDRIFNLVLQTKKRIKKVVSTASGHRLDNGKIDELLKTDVFDGTNYVSLPVDKLFVFPYLSSKKYNNQRTISSFSDFKPKIKENTVIKIVGDHKSGKTTLCKFLFNKLRKLDYFPLFCSGSDFKGNFSSVIEKNLKSTFENIERLTDIDSIEVSKRILIIDNLEISSRILFREALKMFGTVIYTCSTGKDFEMSEEEDESYDFESLEIESFYYDKRITLYQKVFDYVKETSSDIDLDKDFESYTKVIENLLKESDFNNSIDPANLIFMSISGLKKSSLSFKSTNAIYRAKLQIILGNALKERGYTKCSYDIAECLLSFVAWKAYENSLTDFDESYFDDALNYRHDEFDDKPLKSSQPFVKMLEEINFLIRNKDGKLRFYSRKLFAFYISIHAMVLKNYGDESALNKIISNGIYNPLNLQILFSIASNYDYVSIPEYFISKFYENIMSENIDSNFDHFIDEIDKNTELKNLEIDKNKRQQIRKKQGQIEEQKRKEFIKHKDDYFYYDLKKETLVKIDDLSNKLMIICTILNNFGDNLHKSSKAKLVEMLVKMPYLILNVFLSDIIDKLDVIFVRTYDLLSKAPEIRVSYEYVKKSIIADIHASILSVFDFGTRMISNPLLTSSIKKYLENSKDNLHITQRLMLMSFSSEKNNYISESKDTILNNPNKFVVNSARLIGRRFCFDNFDWVEKNCGEFLTLITKGSDRKAADIKKKKIIDKKTK